MRKIKNIRQLQRERTQLRNRERELTLQIRSGWKDLKKLLHPCNIVEGQIRKYRSNQYEREEQGIFKNILLFAATLLIQKLKKRAEGKIEQFFGNRI